MRFIEKKKQKTHPAENKVNITFFVLESVVAGNREHSEQVSEPCLNPVGPDTWLIGLAQNTNHLLPVAEPYSSHSHHSIHFYFIFLMPR